MNAVQKIVAAAVLGLASPVAPAEILVQGAIEDATPEQRSFYYMMNPGQTVEGVLELVESEFDKSSTAAPVIRADDLAVHKAISDAGRHAQLAAGIMTNDLDADGFVTEDEIRREYSYRYRGTGKFEEAHVEKDTRKMLELWLPFDTDGDGRIAWQEAIAADPVAFPMFPDRQLEDSAERLEWVMTFDADDDGSVTLAEFSIPAIEMFRRVDADGDGTISQEEHCAFIDSLAFATNDNCP